MQVRTISSWAHSFEKTTDRSLEYQGTLDAGRYQYIDAQVDKKKPKDLVKSITSFRIIFEGTPQSRTTSVSSDELKAAQHVDKIQDKIMGIITLHTVRRCGKLYVCCHDQLSDVFINILVIGLGLTCSALMIQTRCRTPLYWAIMFWWSGMCVSCQPALLVSC